MSHPSVSAAIAPQAAAAAVPALPRVLAGIPADGALTLEEHLAVHGPVPGARARRRRDTRERGRMLIGEVERAGLLGRGGAGFPAARKMRAVAGARRRAIVLANGAEGEPASFKDRTLLEALPHLVLDGGVLAAEAIGADEVIVCVCESSTEGLRTVARAIAERERAAERHSPRMRLAAVPRHYVAGQETALVNHLNGGPAQPTFTPPMTFEQGVGRRPTLVNNVETLAHIALIARHGAPWFRQLGTPSEPGSTLVTLLGPLAYPGVYEIEHAGSLGSVIDAAGGATAGVQGALVGGYAGTWIRGESLRELSLSGEHLAYHGASLGAGVVLLLSDDACPVSETARLARWMAGQSTRQCGPCEHGLDALAGTVEQLAAGGAQAETLRRAEALAALTARRGACAHPDGAVRMLLSALGAFAVEFADHARHGPCERCASPSELPLPAVTPYDAAERAGTRRR